MRIAIQSRLSMELLLLLITLRSEILSLLLRHPTETELIFGTHKTIHSKIKLPHQAFKCALSGAERMESTDCSQVVWIMKFMLTSNTKINKPRKTNLEKFPRKSSLLMSNKTRRKRRLSTQKLSWICCQSQTWESSLLHL